MSHAEAEDQFNSSDIDEHDNEDVPSNDPNSYLDPIKGEGKINQIKNWLSGQTPFLPELDRSNSDIFAMRKALVHGFQYITRVLYPSSVRLAKILAEDVTVHKDFIIAAGNRFQWEAMDEHSFLHETDGDRILLMLGAERKEIIWVKEEMEHLKAVGAEALKRRVLSYHHETGFDEYQTRAAYTPRRRPDMR